MFVSKFSKFFAHSLCLSFMLSCCNFFNTFAMESKPSKEILVKHNWKFKNYDCNYGCPNKANANADSYSVYTVENGQEKIYNFCHDCAKKKILVNDAIFASKEEKVLQEAKEKKNSSIRDFISNVDKKYEFGGTKNFDKNKMTIECIICQEDRTVGNSRICTQCGYLICESCYLAYDNKNICPMCKQEPKFVLIYDPTEKNREGEIQLRLIQILANWSSFKEEKTRFLPRFADICDTYRVSYDKVAEFLNSKDSYICFLRNRMELLDDKQEKEKFENEICLYLKKFHECKDKYIKRCRKSNHP